MTTTEISELKYSKTIFPNETDEYRAARDALLRSEAELRAQVERVAAQRREMPLGGEVAEDYAFEELAGGVARTLKLSELFSEDRDHLFLYSFMYGPSMDAPCPMCSSLLDALNGNAAQLAQRVNLVIAARSPIGRVTDFAKARGWDRLRMVSAANNTYTRDYFGEDAEGNQLPMANVFVRREGRIHHFWAAELFWSEPMAGTNPRHLDMMWPLWNLLDLTPDGRGDWYPSLESQPGKSISGAA